MNVKSRKIVVAPRNRLLASLFAALVLTLAAPAAMAEGEKINLNQASAETLQVLPGVGPSRAEMIVELREKLGGFETLEQLLEVNGIGARTLDAIRQHGTLQGGVSEVAGEPVNKTGESTGEGQPG